MNSDLSKHMSGNEVTGEKFKEIKVECPSNTRLPNLPKILIPENHTHSERSATVLRVHKNCARTGDLSTELRQIRLNSLRPGGKGFLLLSSKSPMCETIGWIPGF